MRKNEIKAELELCVRSFIEARERSRQKAIDDFDDLRILEASFNRLFISVEHLCNAILLVETGNFSKKHFGDFGKLKYVKDKYKSDLARIYQITYNFRSYADYRKFPEIKDRFKRSELQRQVMIVGKAVRTCINIIGKHMELGEIPGRL